MDAHGAVDLKDPLWTLLAGVLGPPIIWAVRFGASYVLVPVACTAELIALLHGLTIAALLATVALGYLAWRQRRETPHMPAVRPAHEDDARTADQLARIRFMALLGVLSSALFSLVMVAEGLANVFLDPCITAGPLKP